MLTTLTEFTARINALTHIGEAYNVFEFECTDELRDTVYSFAAKDADEPFRSAMHNLGFVAF